MFVRIKKVKSYRYAYLVESKWRKKSCKQKVKEYLGRVHNLEKKNDIDFNENISKLSYQQYVNALMKWQLKVLGFEENQGKLVKGKFSIDLHNKKFLENKKSVVFEANEGIICSHTYGKLLSFNEQGDYEVIGLKFAKAIVDAGINMPKEAFVKIFEKVYK